MGWSSGGRLFEAPARELQKALWAGQVAETAVTDALTALGNALRDEDWDTIGESVEEFNDEPCIMQAFKNIGWEPYDGS